MGAIDYEKISKLKSVLELNRVYCYKTSDTECYYFVPLSFEPNRDYSDFCPKRDCVWTFNSRVTDGVITRWGYNSLYLPYFTKRHAAHTYITQSKKDITKLKLKGIIPSDLAVY